MIKGRITGIILSVMQFVLIAAAAVLLYLRGIHLLHDVYIINISVDILAMAVGHVLFVCCLIDVQKNSSYFNYYYMLVNIMFMALFSDLCAWLVDGIPQLRLLNLLDNTVYYLSGSFAVYYFFKYLVDIINAEGIFIRIMDRIMKLGLVLAVLLRLINIPTGIIFTVGEDGIYHRSPAYPLSIIYMTASIIIGMVIIAVYGKHLKRYQRIALYMYVSTPLVMNVLTAAFYGLSLMSAVSMIILLLMYCVLNINQGRDKALADRDLDMANAIQERMLPQTFPPFPERKEFSVHAYMKPAKEVGGDFYDFYLIDEDHMALVIADVSGKGVPAALFMMVSKVLIQSRLQSGDSPGEALGNINDMILSNSDRVEMFVTAWICVIEISTGHCIVANAGHEHPVIRRAGGEYEYVKYHHSPAVATIPGIIFREHELKLSSGDTLFVYTDGVLEATNRGLEQYGADRLLRTLNGSPDAGVDEMIANVAASVEAFTGKADQFDDITMLAFRYNGA